MLPPDYLINNVDEITSMYDDLHTDVVESIARHIADTLRAAREADLIPTTAYQIARAQRAGILFEEIIKRVAKINRMSYSKVRKLFETAAIESRAYDDRVYKAAGIEPIPIKQSPEMVRILEAGISKQMGSLSRMTGTIAINAQARFEELLNTGYNKISSGAYSYAQAITETVDELARQGVPVFSYESGRKISVEAAVRMNLLTGANQTAGQITHQSMIDNGVSLVRTSAHLGARNTGEGFRNHENWQGKVFHWKEIESQMKRPPISFEKEYPDYIESCGHGDVQGIYGANCKHTDGPYIEGLSPETYTKADLDKYADKTVTYNGKKYKYYDATQIQRAMERQVRYCKKRLRLKEATGLDSTVEKLSVRNAQKTLTNFLEQTGLKRDATRERIAQ